MTTPNSTVELARKLGHATFEVKVAGKWHAIDDRTTEAVRDEMASSIADETDPVERKRLIRELLDSVLTAMHRGRELAAEVLKGHTEPTAA